MFVNRVALVMLFALPGCLRAQIFATPTQSQCDSAIALANSDLRRFFTDSPIAHCGAAGATAIANAIPSLALVADTYVLDGAVVTASARNASVFSAADQLVRNSAATQAARFGGIAILLQQVLGAGSRITVGSGESSLATFADTTTLCAVTEGDSTYIVGAPLPSGYLGTAKSSLEAVITDASVSPSLRAAARCARNHFVPQFLPPIDPTQLDISYICGTRFRIHNSAAAALLITYEIEGVETEQTVVVRPGAESLVSTDHVGPVTFRYGTQLLGVLQNGALSCPSTPE